MYPILACLGSYGTLSVVLAVFSVHMHVRTFRSTSNTSRVKLDTNSQRMTQEAREIIWKAIQELLGCRRNSWAHTHTRAHTLFNKKNKERVFTLEYRKD